MCPDRRSARRALAEMIEERLDLRRENVDGAPHDETVRGRAPRKRRRGHGNDRQQHAGEECALQHVGNISQRAPERARRPRVYARGRVFSERGWGPASQVNGQPVTFAVCADAGAHAARPRRTWRRPWRWSSPPTRPTSTPSPACRRHGLLSPLASRTDARPPGHRGARHPDRRARVGACRLWKRSDSAPPDARLGSLIAICSLAVLCHILMDLPTSYGTRLLSPFDWHWFAVDWMPIVDIYLLAALAGLLFGRVSPDARRRNAVPGAGPDGRQLQRSRRGAPPRARSGAAALRRHAARALRAGGPARHAPIDYWPRPVAAPAPGGRRCLGMTAMPTFASPFEWRVVAHLSNRMTFTTSMCWTRAFVTPATPSEVLWRRPCTCRTSGRRRSCWPPGPRPPKVSRLLALPGGAGADRSGGRHDRAVDGCAFRRRRGTVRD